MLPGGFAVQQLGPKRGLELGLLGSTLLLLALPSTVRRGGAGAVRLALPWLCMCGLGVLQAPLMPATSALQREWMPPSLGAERVWSTPARARPFARSHHTVEGYASAACQRRPSAASRSAPPFCAACLQGLAGWGLAVGETVILMTPPFCPY